MFAQKTIVIKHSSLSFSRTHQYYQCQLQDYVRQEALHMLRNALEGSSGNAALSAYTEAYRIIMRLAVGDKSFIVRIAAARCLKAFANIGGPGLGVGELDNSASYCVKVFFFSFLAYFKSITHLNFQCHICRHLKILFHLFGMPLLKLWEHCLLLEWILRHRYLSFIFWAFLPLPPILNANLDSPLHLHNC